MTATAQTKLQTVSCAHCGLPVPGSFIDSQSCDISPRFCCTGCAVVYQCIQDNNLGNFYEIRERVSDTALQPAAISASNFTAFDDPLFFESHVKVQTNGIAQITFYLSDMHCAACVWLLEKVPTITTGVQSVSIVFGRSLIHVQFDPAQTKISEIAKTLNALGYPPKPLQKGASPEGSSISRSMLIRLGVAGVAAGNSMMLAISLYQGYFTGMDLRYRLFFEWISLLITTPAVLYSATPFYKAALQGLKRKVLHIDLPISIGIISGYIASVAQLLLGNPHIYFDSIAMLIFLLLGGRILQRASIDRSINTKSILSTFIPIVAMRKEHATTVETYIEALKVGDTITVTQRQVIPADGYVTTGNASIDCALLTGESTPLTAECNTPVFAGTTVLSGTIDIAVENVGSATRLGRLMELIEQADAGKTQLQTITDRISAVFVFVVITLACGSAGYFLSTTHWSIALERTLALLIVSCPCALGMAAPLAFATAIRRAATNGILIRDASALEIVAKVSAAVFDKTGTLTKRIAPVTCCYARDEAGTWGRSNSIQHTALSQALALEQQISHPIASSIVSYLLDLGVKAATTPVQIEKIPATGVSGKWADGKTIALISPAASAAFLDQKTLRHLPTTLINALTSKGQTPVVAIQNGIPTLLFAIDNPIKSSARQLVEYCEAQGIKSWLLSGDTPLLTETIGHQLGISKDKTLGGQSPEAKVRAVNAIKQSECVMMVGDGANDAAALRTADVGVAMGGGAELSLAAAPIFLATDQPHAVISLIHGAKRAIATIRTNIAISVCYNTLGATLAILGYINPLVAAILMPLSSLSVVAISLLRPSFKGH